MNGFFGTHGTYHNQTNERPINDSIGNKVLQGSIKKRAFLEFHQTLDISAPKKHIRVKTRLQLIWVRSALKMW